MGFKCNMKAQLLDNSDVAALAAAALQHYEEAFEDLRKELVAVLQTQALVEHGRKLGIKVIRTPKKPKAPAPTAPGDTYTSYFKDLVSCVILQEPADTRPQLVKILSKELNLPVPLLVSWVRHTVHASEH